MREELKQIYSDTKGKGNKLPKISTTVKKSIKKNYFEGHRAGEIIVTNTDTISAVLETSSSDIVCMLNMASYKRPGGGVENGAQAQEEALFRCTDLYKALKPEFYPLRKFEYLYTSNAQVFKDKDYKWLKTPRSVDCMTIAALKMSEINKITPAEYEKITLSKIHAMIDIPQTYGANILVLGAWGCGAYGNDPTIISAYFKKVLEKKRYLYDQVIFAVINDKNSTDDNLKVFSDTFEETPY